MNTHITCTFLFTKVVPQVVGDVAVLSYWTFSDIFEEVRVKSMIYIKHSLFQMKY